MASSEFPLPTTKTFYLLPLLNRLMNKDKFYDIVPLTAS